jgi:hypothetical protein
MNGCALNEILYPNQIPVVFHAAQVVVELYFILEIMISSAAVLYSEMIRVVK